MEGDCLPESHVCKKEALASQRCYLRDGKVAKINRLLALAGRAKLSINGQICESDTADLFGSLFHVLRRTAKSCYSGKAPASRFAKNQKACPLTLKLTSIVNSVWLDTGHQTSIVYSRSFTSSDSSFSSAIVASILTRLKSSTSRPWTIEYSPSLHVTGNE